MENKKEILSYLDTAGLIVIAVMLFVYPIAFSTLTTDFFVLPKQIVILVGIFLSLLLFGIRTLIDGKLRLRSTPLDLPVFLFAGVMFVSAILSANRTDSLIAFIPLLFAALLYFLIVNIVRDRRGILFVTVALISGTALSAVLTILSFFKLYLLPFDFTHVQYFTTMGSLLDQVLFMGIVLPLAAYLAHPAFSVVLLKGKTEEATSYKKFDVFNIIFSIGFVIITFGVILALFQLVTSQKPLILPFETGFQTAFASISQDSGRVLKSFLLGSGYGTYLTDFTRFKQASYNANPNLWSFSFFRSSSFVLELLATTGFLGVLSYLFIIFRVLRERWFFLPLVLVIIASFFLPFSYVIQAAFFIILGIFGLVRGQQNPRRYPSTELYLVALDQGLLTTKPESQDGPRGKSSLILPGFFVLLLVVFIGFFGFFSGRFIVSDSMFQRSLVAASQNNGGATYQLQREAITMFPYRDAYYRVFSQTNLALANNLAAAQPKGASPSAQTQQTILTLIQQSINSGRSAVTISPQTSLNWNNLSSIYRSLIGFGQNADQFAVLTNKQAVTLDPNNPQQYINLGGIYYQLGQWEEAQRQFQLAITLKPDYANAYYNLGHSLESKGDLKNALQVYQTVRTMVSNDPHSLKQIDQEIATLQQKVAQGARPVLQTPQAAQPTAESLNVNQPQAKLPERNPKVSIPGPSDSPTPKASGTPTPTGEVSPTETANPTPNL
jgi:tetratricopeptide (TPR) repeat protein